MTLRQDNEPGNPVEGMLWVDTSGSNVERKDWTGDRWELDVAVGPDQPDHVVEGARWSKTDTDELQIYDGSNWQTITPASTQSAEPVTGIEEIGPTAPDWWDGDFSTEDSLGASANYGANSKTYPVGTGGYYDQVTFTYNCSNGYGEVTELAYQDAADNWTIIDSNPPTPDNSQSYTYDIGPVVVTAWRIEFTNNTGTNDYLFIQEIQPRQIHVSAHSHSI